MARLDEHLRQELERAAHPADPSGVYEHLIRGKERRRIAQRVQHGVLAVAVVAGSVGAVIILSEAFQVADRGRVVGSPPARPPSSVPPGTPTMGPSPTDERISDVGLGLRLCDVSSVRGRFLGEGDASQTAFVGTGPADGGCPNGEEPTGVAALDLTGDGLADVASEPFGCQGGCLAYAAPDVDGDGTDELLVQNVLFTIVGLRLFDVVSDEDGPALVMAMVEPPGDAALGMEGFDGSGPPQFWIGGDAFVADSLRCETQPGGRVLISTTAESLPHDSPDAVWQIHETTFELRDGLLRVVEARDLEEPAGLGTTPSFMSTGGCGADLEPRS